MLCGQASLVKQISGSLHGRVLRCKAWTCPDCAPKRRSRLIAEAAGGQPSKFITLTMRADDPRDDEEKVKALSRAWRVMRSRICRRYNIKTIPFLAVVERTKRGTPHLHILARARYIDQRYLSTMAAELLDAPIVDIRHVDQHRNVSAYVAKYLGKNPEKIGSAKRYWQSPNYDLRPPMDKQADGVRWSWFDLVKKSLIPLVTEYETLGFSASWLGPDRVILTAPAPPFWRSTEPAR